MMSDDWVVSYDLYNKTFTDIIIVFATLVQHFQARLEPTRVKPLMGTILIVCSNLARKY
jgi:hypothetical protein